jgi:ATP-binding cassette subfamily B protein
MKNVIKIFKKYTFIALITIILTGTSAILNLYLPNYMSQIINKGIITKDINFIYKIALNMVFIVLLSLFLSLISHLTSAKIATSYAKDLRKEVFNKVIKFSLPEFDSFSIASLITRNTNDINQIQQFTIMMMRMVIRAPILAIGGAFMAFSLNSQISSILFISIPVLIAGIFLLIKKTMPLFKDLQNKIDKINLIVRENLLGIRVIRAFNKEDYETSRFSNANLDFTKTAKKLYRINALIFPLMTFVMSFTTISVIFYGAFLIDKNKFNLGNLMAVMQYVMQILFSFAMISFIFTFLPRALTSINRIEEILIKNNSILNKKETKSINLISKNKNIIFENVSFYYPASKEPVLIDINFEIPEGKTTAIIGNTGSGKSTLILLLLRLYDVSSGSIKIGNIDIRDINQEELHNLFGYAPSKPIIFNDTIFENIRYGRNIEEKDVLEAARISEVLEFVGNKPEGINTIVSQNGTDLSGGQKQRISIARAIAEKKPFYIFDDTFSALDFKTDSKIRKEISEIYKDSTNIIISQRITTIMNSHQIIVLHDGKISGIGTHQSLLRDCDVYQQFVQSQLSEKEIKEFIK